MKHILPGVIDEEKITFVKGGLIMDNVLIAMECFHWMMKKKKGKSRVMALKFDMSKAYDRLECIFIDRVLGAMGFSRPSNSFSPKKRLRQ